MAALVSQNEDAPTHLRKHALVMQMLSLDQLHQHVDHKLYTMEVLAAGDDSQSTTDSEKYGTWFTQHEIDLVECHKDQVTGKCIMHNGNDPIDPNGKDMTLLDLQHAGTCSLFATSTASTTWGQGRDPPLTSSRRHVLTLRHLHHLRPMQISKMFPRSGRMARRSIASRRQPANL